ncbi:uncharacterized protein LOC129744139 isoform X2 [Uranotaenia lowii]|uniref:uncharacterized protein LOC129744139 isoform X2 n=1 Tax=Uranotaenia lowii TaxID=190385 RepID=UPI00247B0AC6|nr:uncharacterized protein LOC129744139 isoform X2 [Uranotaenia lowii]
MALTLSGSDAGVWKYVSSSEEFDDFSIEEQGPCDQDGWDELFIDGRSLRRNECITRPLQLDNAFKKCVLNSSVEEDFFSDIRCLVLEQAMGCLQREVKKCGSQSMKKLAKRMKQSYKGEFYC